MSRSLNSIELRGERFPPVGPFEGMRPLLVVAPNIGHDLGDEGLPRSPNASLENVFCEDVEPYFDLVQPRGIRRREVQAQTATFFNP